ncbi:MAG: asparagine synthase (glutamine-hydrolyzing) [Pelomonas sp.]|nr:asparagine synthase (glutamine-hydrolyzing) [Roseateles sp.]
MCGINGSLTRTAVGSGELRARVVAMNNAIAHRGPDGSGVFERDGVALGHRRLSIIDLSEAGAQPMHSADGTLTLVFNGEIYNYLELTQELQALGCQFRSHSDSEVILHAYRVWGESCVRRFNGMWAFAIWDERERRLFASRDRLGVKPFFFMETGDELLFSSEIAGLRTVRPLNQANLAKLHDYLAYGYRTNNGETMLQGVLELLPGHEMVWRLDGGRLAMRRYWSLEEARVALPPPAERPGALAELLRDAVRLRFRSDVPVALLQSGGIDSSVICTIVNDEIDAGHLGALDTVTAFTATHPGHAYDEAANVRALMATCPHIRSMELTPGGEALAQDFRAYVRAMQEPMSGAASYAHWKLMQAVRAQGIKVVINGQGADEALAGYGFYIRGYRMLDLLQTDPLAAWREARAIRANMPFGYGGLVAQTVKAMMGRRLASRMRASLVEGSAGMLAPAFRSDHANYLPDLPMVGGGGNLDRHLRGQLHDYGFNQILHYEDQSSMSHGVEIRSPFIDYRLMEFAFALSDEEKFSGGVTKKILRDAFRGRVPAQIIESKVKLGFATPFADWLRGDALQSFVRQLVSSPTFKDRNIWHAAPLATKLSDPKASSGGFPSWRFIMTALWLEEFGVTNA